MPDNPELDAVDDASAALATSTEKTVDAVSQVAEDIQAAASVGDVTSTAMAGAMNRIAATQNRIIQLVETVHNDTQETLNALSRAISNTDISAQRAAEASQTIAEQIEPPEESAPDSGEKPAQIEALPRTQATTEKEAREQYWFGKAARRHQKATG